MRNRKNCYANLILYRNYYLSDLKALNTKIWFTRGSGSPLESAFSIKPILTFKTYPSSTDYLKPLTYESF